MIGTRRGERGARRREGLPGIGLGLVSWEGGTGGRTRTVRMAVVEEDLWSFCCVAGDLDDVAVSPTGAAALKAFAAHGEIGRLLEDQGKQEGTGDFAEVVRCKRCIC